MAVRSINNTDSRLSNISTLGIAGAGIGAGVGYFTKPTIDSLVITAQNSAIKNNTSDIKFLINTLKEIKENGIKSISKETKNALKEKGYKTTIKSIKEGIVDLIEEKTLLQGGKKYEKALKRLANNTTSNKDLLNKAQNALELKLLESKEYLELFHDGILNLFKTTASPEIKAEMQKISQQTIKNNAIKGGLIGASIALGLGIISLLSPNNSNK